MCKGIFQCDPQVLHNECPVGHSILQQENNTEGNVPSRDEIRSMKRPELVALAKSKRIKGHSKVKPELQAIVLAALHPPVIHPKKRSMQQLPPGAQDDATGVSPDSTDSELEEGGNDKKDATDPLSVLL